MNLTLPEKYSFVDLTSHCNYINMARKKTNDVFIDDIKKIHGDFYDCSQVKYLGSSKAKVKIFCPVHGEFEMLPNNLLQAKPKMACYQCRGIKLSSYRTFLLESVKTHGDKYDYSLVDYVNSNTKVKIICKKHGVFEQNPNKHVKGQGCSKCRDDKLSFNKTDILNMFYKVHGDRYDYSNVGDEIRDSDKVCIICKKHGNFFQSVNKHKNGHGCPICANPNVFRDTKAFIEESNDVHHNCYNYSKTEYKNVNSKVIVTCKVHGDFLISPKKHLCGQGCRKCSLKNSKGEIEIDYFLSKNNFFYKKEYRFNSCRDKNPLPFDFAVFKDEACKELKCLIEYDGEQHFKIANWYGLNNRDFEKTKKHDMIKNNFCLSENIRFLRIPYWQLKNIHKVLENFIKNI